LHCTVALHARCNPLQSIWGAIPTGAVAASVDPFPADGLQSG
jgi:hypothetical protein